MPPPHHHDHHHHHGHHHPHHGHMEDWDDYWFEELPPHLKDAAGVLGWTKDLWDQDGKADTEDLDWGQLSHEQRQAAEAFGYHPKLWDEGEGHHHPPPHHHEHEHGHHHKHEDHKEGAAKKEEEKKQDEEEVDADVSKLDINDEKTKKEKPQFKLSKSYGGDGGDKFDHGNNRSISKMIVYTDGHVVKGLEVSYANATQKAGNCKGKSTTLELERGEFITSVTVRSNKYVQSLGFKTNKGKMLGPVGGQGWAKIDLRGNDTEGEEVKVSAPFKYQLCGFTGRAGDKIDQVAFRWGPVPNPSKKN